MARPRGVADHGAAKTFTAISFELGIARSTTYDTYRRAIAKLGLTPTIRRRERKREPAEKLAAA